MNRKRKKRIVRSAVVVRSSQTRVKPSAKKSTEKVTFQTAVGTVKECVLNICEKLCHVAKRFVLFIGTFLPVVFDRIGYGFSVVVRVSVHGAVALVQGVFAVVKRVLYDLKTAVLIFAEDVGTLRRMSLKQLVTWPRDTVRVFLKRTQKSRKDIADSIRSFKMPTREQLAAFAAEAFNKTKKEVSTEYLKIVTQESKMGDKTYRAKKRLFSASCSVAVCLLILILGAYSFGWFSNVQKVKTNGMSVSLPDQNIVLNIHTYAYDLDTRQGTEQLAHESELLDIADYEFNTHDVVFTSLNKYTTTILRLDISGACIEYGEDGAVKVTIRRKATSTTTVSKLEAYTGHILCIRAVNTVADARLLLNGNVDAVWRAAKAYFESNTNTWQSANFTTKTGTNSYTVRDSVSFTVTYRGEDVNQTSGSVSILVYLDYDEALTKDFEDGLGFEETTVSGLIHLENDFYEIRVQDAS